MPEIYQPYPQIKRCGYVDHPESEEKEPCFFSLLLTECWKMNFTEFVLFYCKRRMSLVLICGLFPKPKVFMTSFSSLILFIGRLAYRFVVITGWKLLFWKIRSWFLPLSDYLLRSLKAMKHLVRTSRDTERTCTVKTVTILHIWGDFCY